MTLDCTDHSRVFIQSWVLYSINMKQGTVIFGEGHLALWNRAFGVGHPAIGSRAFQVGYLAIQSRAPSYME